MPESYVKIEGDAEVKKAIRKLADPATTLDQAFKDTHINSMRRLIQTTNRQSGTTAGNWKSKTHGKSSYEVSNDTKTDDKKHLIVSILDQGRKAVYPVKAKKLYIPFTDKGRAKDKDAVWGIDFVLADMAKAYAGTKFIQKELVTAGKELVGRIIKIIKAVA